MLQDSKATPSAKNSPGLVSASKMSNFAPEVVNIRVRIKEFRALESGESSTLAMKMEQPSALVSLVLPSKKSCVVNVAAWNPASEAQNVEIRFWMNRTEYLLLGIASSNQKTMRSEQFPRVVIENEGNYRIMSVTLERPTKAVTHEFQILAQKIETGELTVVREAEKDNE